MSKRPWFLITILTVAITGAGCGGHGGPIANCLSGKVSFGGEPGSAMPLPSAAQVSHLHHQPGTDSEPDPATTA